jgi:hypothetical protein
MGATVGEHRYDDTSDLSQPGALFCARSQAYTFPLHDRRLPAQAPDPLARQSASHPRWRFRRVDYRRQAARTPGASSKPALLGLREQVSAARFGQQSGEVGVHDKQLLSVRGACSNRMVIGSATRTRRERHR